MTPLRKFLRLGLPLGAAFLLLALGRSVMVAHADGATISGAITSPGGYPLPAGTVVNLLEPGTDAVRGQATPNPGDGAFSIGPVSNGLYLLRAVPTAASGFTPSLPQLVSVFNAPVSGIALALTTPQFTGTVTAPDGTTPITASVIVYAGNTLIVERVAAPGGHFAVGGLPPGGYGLQAFRGTDDPYFDSPITTTTLPGAPPIITLTLTNAQLYGVVKDDLNHPVADATVVAARNAGDHAATHAGPGGYWTLGGLADGAYALAAFPPWDRPGLLPSTPISVTLPGASNPYTLTLPSAPKTVTGTVSTNTGTPVFHALVRAERLNARGHAEALTANDGKYTLNLAPGLWALTVHVLSDTNPSNWVNRQPPQLVHFHHNAIPESEQVDFTVLTADATVIGLVELPGGGAPPFTVTVGLFSNEGVGRRTTIDPATGAFTLTVPNGGYQVVVHPESPDYLGPDVPPFSVAPNSTYDLGPLTLLAKASVITGTVTDENGDGVTDIPVIAWRPGVPGQVDTHTGPDGSYVLAVAAGTWHVQPAPHPDQPYLYTGDGQEVDVAASSSVSGVNFNLLNADATISGVLVDTYGDPATDAAGFASARNVLTPTIHASAPIGEGAFLLHVPGGTYHLVAHLPAGSTFLSTDERDVVATAGSTTLVTLTVEVKDAVIDGTVRNARDQSVVSGLDGVVGAWSGDDWVAAPIERNGAYHLEVAAGLWNLDYRIDPTNYAKLRGARIVPVQSGQTVHVPLSVAPKDSAITGEVLGPDGSPVGGARVIAHGLSGVVDDLWLDTLTRPNGTFTLPVPFGRYRVGATMITDSIKPVEHEVDVPPGATVALPQPLQFRLLNAVITGTLTISGATPSGLAHVWAWSEDGGFGHGSAAIVAGSGAYTLNVISGTMWHVGAVFANSADYWIGRAARTPGSGPLDVTLDGPFHRPGPVVVTFDASEAQGIALADGTELFIPAGAMPVSGTVTLRIEPIFTLSGHRGADIFRYGYAFLATDEDGQPIEEHFNQDVVIRFPYDEAELRRQGVREEWLKPAYFSTTANHWTFPDSYVVDTSANEVTMQIDHFTDFALTSNPNYTVYLPIVSQ